MTAMRLGALDELSPADARTVIVNVHTDLWATRALLSAVELAGMPVLLLNCDPTDDSTRGFNKLMAEYEFDVLDAPLRRHGDTLDWLFGHTGDAQLLLLDSDAELRDRDLVARLRAALANQRVFAAGYREGPFWMDEDWWAPHESLLYMERPWMPCVLWRVDAARRALAAGRHFAELLVPNEIACSASASRLLAARFPRPWGTRGTAFDRLPERVQARLRTWSLDWLRWARRDYYGLKPKMACYDTGARVYEYLRYEAGLVFAGDDVELLDCEVHHYGGITRSKLFGAMPLDTLQEDVDGEVRERLASRYGYVWSR